MDEAETMERVWARLMDAETRRAVVEAGRQRRKAEGLKTQLEECEAQLRDCTFKLVDATIRLDAVKRFVSERGSSYKKLRKIIHIINYNTPSGGKE